MPGRALYFFLGLLLGFGDADLAPFGLLFFILLSRRQSMETAWQMLGA